MKILVTTILLLILIYPVHSQNNKFANEDQIWLDGYAYLTSGEKIKGKINYSFVTQTIQVKIGKAIKTYPAKDINRFIRQNSQGEKSEYVSMFVPLIAKGDIDKFEFGYKVIKESNQFLLVNHKNTRAAVLSNLCIDRENYFDIDATGSTTTREVLIERVYILDERATPIPILLRLVDKRHKYKAGSSEYIMAYDEKANQYTKKTPKNLKKEDPNYKLVNKDFLEELDSKNYRKLEAYIEKEDIDIKTVEGLIQVIDYWSEI